METFPCIFVLFQVMSWLFSIPLRTVNNTETQENVSACTGPRAIARPGLSVFLPASKIQK